MTRFPFAFLILLILFTPVNSQPRSDSTKTPTLTEKVAGMEKFPGYFTFYWEAKTGKLWLEIDKWNTEFFTLNHCPQASAQTISVWIVDS